MTSAILFPEEGSCVESSTYLGERGISYVLSQTRHRPIPEDAVFCMNCGEKIETSASEADSAPAEITPAEEAPIPASGKKPKKKKAVLLVSVLALLLVAVALANSSLFQSNIAAKAEKRIVGSWNGVFLENGDDTIRAKNLGGSTCTVEKGGAATISFSERSISD